MAANPWGNDPHHMSAVRLVFSFLHGFTVHNLASSAYVSIFPYDHFIRFVAHVAARALRNVSLFLSLRHANVRREGGIPSRWRTRISLFTCSLALARFLSLRSQSPLRQLFRERLLRGWNKCNIWSGPRTRVKRFSILVWNKLNESFRFCFEFFFFSKKDRFLIRDF